MKHHLFYPSIARRLLLSLVAAFMLTGLVLTGKSAFFFYNQSLSPNGEIPKFGRVLLATLNAVSDKSEAILATRAVEDLFNASIQDSQLNSASDPARVFFQLKAATGELLYESIPSDHLLTECSPPVARIRMQEHEFVVHTLGSDRWTLRIGVPLFSPGRVIGAIVMDLAPELLLSFPLVLLPVWFAIRRGLQPLNKLSEYLAARRDDDLSPLSITMKYAEMERVTSALDSLLTRLRRKLDHERAFIQEAAHELRTPMAVVAAQGHVLAHAGTEESRVQAEAALRDAIRRASHLSEQLLSLATLDQSRTVERSPIDLAAALQNILAELAPAAISRQIDLALDAPDCLIFPMSRVAFYSIAQNLVDNAIRYGDEGGRVAVTLKQDKDDVELRVADDGPGIPAQDRERVFERFYRGTDNDATGTGLGLAIVSKAVNSMGGTIHAGVGLDNGGVAFVVTFRT